MKNINCSETTIVALQNLEKVVGVMFGRTDLKCFTATHRPIETWYNKDLPRPTLVAIRAKFMNFSGRLHTVTPGMISVFMEIPMFSSKKTGIRVVPREERGLVREIFVTDGSRTRANEEFDVIFEKSGLIRVRFDQFANRPFTQLVGFGPYNRWMEPFYRPSFRTSDEEPHAPDFQI